MWDQPHYVYTVYDREAETVLAAIEHSVPGVLAHARVNRRRLRLGKDEIPERITNFTLWTPAHAGWLVEFYLNHFGLAFDVEDRGGGRVEPWPTDPDKLHTMEIIGGVLIKQMVDRGELKPHVADLATPYQRRGAAWAESRPYVMSVWPCGGGKTVGAVMASLTRRGTVLVVCPAKARHVWWSQVQQYTTILPFRAMPESERRAKDMTWEEYEEHCRENGQRKFVIIGAEALADWLPFVQQLAPEVLIFDELHIHGNSKRWKAIQQSDGDVAFERRRTASGDRDAWAVAVMDASRMPGLSLRVGLTATPLDDGRPRRLWSQLDLLSPGGFAHSYRKFAERYCDAQPNPFGGMDDKGSSNLGELRDRCSFFTHEVPYTESHASLPPTRVQVVYLPVSEQNKVDRFDEKQTYNQAINEIVKQLKGGYEDIPLRERLIEARLSEACSRKRNYVVAEAVEGLKGNGKVVVFTARRREAELWGDAIRKAVAASDDGLRDTVVWTGHGGVSEHDRNQMMDDFRVSTGPCCLVATGQAFGIAVDGMQTASLAIFAMLPWKPGDFIQWRGRFDRHGGTATLLKVVVAARTYDERVVEILTDKFGPIESFLAADELRGMGEKLLGMEDRDALVDNVISWLPINDEEE